MLEKVIKQKLVVIGNGMAGIRTIETLLERAPDLYDITVFGSEPYGNYNRILLSPVLAGEKTVDDIMLNTVQWYDDNNITLRKGETVAMIDRRTCEVVTEAGERVPYDRLLIATGSNPIMLPLPGKDLPGVIGFRDIFDVERMVEASTSHRNAIVIGGGLLGLEAANGLMKRGMNVTVVHLLDTLMERQLDPVAGGLLRKSLEERGMVFRMPAQTQAILGEDRVTAVRFGDGSELPADLVVMAVGIRPNFELAKKAGLYCERGIVVSDTMQTYDGRIYAVGECVQHRRQTYGLVAPLFDQAKVCANHLAMKGFATYDGSVVSTKLKVTGIDLFSAGDFAPGPDKEEIVLQDANRGVYKRIVLRDKKIIGAVLYGDTIDGPWYFQHLRDGTDVSQMRERLVFGAANLGDGGHAGQNSVAAMSDAAEICGCNGVCKGTIVKAITRKEAVHARRRARPHQGVVLVRFLHRTGRAGARVHARRRLFDGAESQAAVQVHRSQPRRRPPRHRRAESEDHPRRHAVHGLEDRQRLPLLPPGAELLSALRPGPANTATTSSRVSSTSGCTPTSRRTAPIRWCRGCGAASPRRANCAPSPTSPTSSTSRR